MLGNAFSVHLNTSFQHQRSAIYEIPDPPEDADNLSPISKDEIEQAKEKVCKAIGIDNITAKVLIIGRKPMMLLLYKISNKIWK